ncbi:hypothetical protein A9G06_04790 [Aeromonas sp. DNP9]|nr:hypothetical protein A9G06_04790 [Aeromonas sp. DNP9]
MKKILLPLCIGIAMPAIAKSPDNSASLQDMSDPLAVYSQWGSGISDDGLNLKFGNQYDSGSQNKRAMNIIEAKGVMGEGLGWSDHQNRDNSLDSLRLRNFTINTESGLGTQLDIIYNFDESYLAEQNASVSYSLIKALPAWGPLQLYPLAGIGANISMNQYIDSNRKQIDAGYTIPGTFYLVGMYSKLTLNEKWWLNYNPMFASTLSGSEFYKENAFGDGESAALYHEVALSYQYSGRLNFRTFINWNNIAGIEEAAYRLEFNYQF